MMSELDVVPVTSPLSEKEWKLVSDIMDCVDQLRQSEPVALDVDRAVGLVKRTYQSQGIVVPAELLQRAVRLALSAFPEPGKRPPVSLPAEDAGLWGRVQQWFFGIRPAEAPVPRATPMDKANALVNELLEHKLMHDADLAQVLVNQRQQLNVRKYQELKQGIRYVLWPIPGIPLGLLGMSLLPQSALQWAVMFAISTMSAAVSLGMLCSFFQKRAFLFGDDFKRLDMAEEGLVSRDYRHYFLQTAITQSKGWQNSTYYCYLESTEEESNWEYYTKVAMEDPVLAKTWKRWLESNDPIRRGDADLLCSAASAIKDAKKWLIYSHQMEFPVQAQARLRAESLEKMERKSLPVSLVESAPTRVA